MRKVLVDNWSMSNIAKGMNGHMAEEYINLLSTLVLWDEIYYPQNDRTSYWNNTTLMGQVNDVIIPYDDKEKLFSQESNAMYHDYYSVDRSEIVVEGAIRYLLLSSWLGCDYLPSKDRAEFIEKFNPIKQCGNKLMRTDFMNLLDNSIIECFNELNAKFHKNVFEIKMPVLADFIIQNTPKNMSHIEYALLLREEKPVVAYRNFLVELEDELNQGHWKKIFEFQKAAEDMVNDIVKIDNKSIVNVSASVSITPSINFSKDIVLKNRLVQLAFLNQLVDFAFYGRKI